MNYLRRIVLIFFMSAQLNIIQLDSATMSGLRFTDR